jgi:hypothetical protein
MTEHGEIGHNVPHEAIPPPYIPIYPTDDNPEITRAALERIKNTRSGWKLHLNFDTTSEPTVAAITHALTALRGAGSINNFKIGNAASDINIHGGKEATVYIGPKDQADAVAHELSTLFADLLLPPAGDATKHDTLLAPQVMGRFDIGRVDRDYYQYGSDGVPYLKADHTRVLGLFGQAKMSHEDARAAADAVLRERYGTFYTGSSPESDESDAPPVAASSAQ